MKSRDINTTKEEIIKIREQIPKETWDKLQELIDEVFIFYIIKMKERTVNVIEENIEHYERHYNNTHNQNIHEIIEDIKNIARSYSDARTEYDIYNLLKEELKYSKKWSN